MLLRTLGKLSITAKIFEKIYTVKLYIEVAQT